MRYDMSEYLTLHKVVARSQLPLCCLSEHKDSHFELRNCICLSVKPAMSERHRDEAEFEQGCECRAHFDSAKGKAESCKERGVEPMLSVSP